MGDCFFSDIDSEASTRFSADVLGSKNYSQHCLYEILVRERLNPFIFLFTRIRSSFSSSSNRILEDEHEVKSEVGGALLLDRSNKVMGSVSNDGDLNFFFSKEGFFSNALLYAWVRRRSSSGLLEADLGSVSSYNDLLIKVPPADQSNFLYSKNPAFKLMAKIEYDFARQQFSTPTAGEFVHDLETARPFSNFVLVEKAEKSRAAASEEPNAAGVMLDFRYELSSLPSSVLKVESMALWYRAARCSAWFQ